MIIEVNNIDIKSILFSGECFRSKLESDGSITNILNDRIINTNENINKLIILNIYLSNVS